MNSETVVLFDGVCNLCSSSVQWIIEHDEKAQFKFTSLQSNTGLEFRKKYNIPYNIDSVILIQNDIAYFKSTAALKIARNCNGAWKMLYGFIVIPRFLRDIVYDFIARNRYKWFGKKEVCWIPDPELKKRFI